MSDNDNPDANKRHGTRSTANVKTRPHMIAAKIKASKAIELRMEGRGFENIAKELGYASRQAAHAAVVRGLQDVVREPAREYLGLELERLESMWQVPYLQALGGDLHSLAACLSIMQRRARLLGLDAPDKKEIAGVNGGPIQTKTVGPDALKTLSAEELSAAISAAEKLSPSGGDQDGAEDGAEE